MCENKCNETCVGVHLQGELLDGHKIELHHSTGRPPQVVENDAVETKKGKRKERGPASNKLIIRNLAFEATRKDLVEVLGPFGHLKSCRVPKKFDGTHRGFAFAEFVTKQEAKSALEGVAGVHLYGRRLVMEYAKDEGDLEQLRAKTRAKFHEA